MGNKKGSKWGSTPERDARRAAARLRHKAYDRWFNMMRRCYEPAHHKFELYGGRGIKVDPAWHEFWAYYAETGPQPNPDLTLDRLDNNGDYGPGNWRWATLKEQLANRRKYRTGKRRTPKTKS